MSPEHRWRPEPVSSVGLPSGRRASCVVRRCTRCLTRSVLVEGRRLRVTGAAAGPEAVLPTCDLEAAYLVMES